MTEAESRRLRADGLKRALLQKEKDKNRICNGGVHLKKKETDEELYTIIQKMSESIHDNKMITDQISAKHPSQITKENNANTQGTFGLSTKSQNVNTKGTFGGFENIPERMDTYSIHDNHKQNEQDGFDYEDYVKRELAALSVEALRDILEDTDVPPNVRISAARYVLDRVLGTPVQKTQVTQTTQNMVLVIGQDIHSSMSRDFIEAQGIIRALPPE